MSPTVVLLDTPPPFLRPGGPEGILGLPLGKSSLLDHLLQRLGTLVEKEPLVLGCPEPEYSAALAGCATQSLRVVSADELVAAIHDLESWECVMLIQARYWPVAGYDHAAIERCLREYRGATYGVALGSDSGEARERVDFDTGGRVRRVQRLYKAVHWPEVAGSSIAYAVVPAWALSDARFSSMLELREQLAKTGILSTDVPVLSETLDLACQGGFLSLHERILREDLQRRRSREYNVLGRDLLAASDSCIHESVRLIPPVVVQRGACIGAGATIVGPALIGSNCRVETGAVVAQSVLAAGAVVTEGTTVRHAVAAGRCTPETLLGQARNYAAAAADRTDRHVELNMPAPRQRRSRAHFIAKRSMDVALSSLGLLILSPLLALIAVLIKLDSHGRVFFTHRRESKDGKEFPCIKFRTMVQDAHLKQRSLYRNNEVDGPQFKMRDDPRVTRVGRWLRATNADELPQLFNVVLGHMSLVGPRPSPFRENQICVPWRRARLSVRPGITGLWQICRDEERHADFHKWIYYDMMYVRHFSFWLDVKILLATVFTLGGKWSVPLHWIIRNYRGDKLHPQPMLAT